MRSAITRSVGATTASATAPDTELGYSFAASEPGAAEVFRCKRPGTTVDLYLSRDPACGGNIVEASLGYAL